MLLFSAGKTFWDQRVGVRIRVVVLNSGTNETHGCAKMGEKKPDERDAFYCLVFSLAPVLYK